MCIVTSNASGSDSLITNSRHIANYVYLILRIASRYPDILEEVIEGDNHKHNGDGAHKQRCGAQALNSTVFLYQNHMHLKGWSMHGIPSCFMWSFSAKLLGIRQTDQHNQLLSPDMGAWPTEFINYDTRRRWGSGSCPDRLDQIDIHMRKSRIQSNPPLPYSPAPSCEAAQHVLNKGYYNRLVNSKGEIDLVLRAPIKCACWAKTGLLTN